MTRYHTYREKEIKVWNGQFSFMMSDDPVVKEYQGLVDDTETDNLTNTN